MKKIILASGSDYRKQQLQRLCLDFTSVNPNVDEDALKSNSQDHVQLSVDLALLKARSVSENNKDSIVIGGDQVASFDNTLLSKPQTKQNAVQQLKSLSGREHRLITSLAIVCNGQEYVHTSIAKMKMRHLNDEQIERYIALDDPLWCCGAYRIEALGISLFDSIDCEDHTSIIGMPLIWTAKTLSMLGVSIP